jgi:hypothetical protein
LPDLIFKDHQLVEGKRKDRGFSRISEKVISEELQLKLFGKEFIFQIRLKPLG